MSLVLDRDKLVASTRQCLFDWLAESYLSMGVQTVRLWLLALWEVVMSEERCCMSFILCLHS